MRKDIKILLSSPIQPYGPKFGDSFSCLASSCHQLTWAQDIFRVEDQMCFWGIDLIAANINTPTVVLQYPTKSQFIKEIKNSYDYIGLSFNVPTFHKVKRMVAAVRKYSPKSKIILGGYGTLLPDEELNGLGDYICREEGIGFMRKLLGEAEKPFVGSGFIIKRRVLSLAMGDVGIVFSALGCPNGCNFCPTSNYYKKEKTYFYKTGNDLFNAILEFKKANKSLGTIHIFDEDFLIDKNRAIDFLDSARKSKEYLNVMIFASVKSLSQFSASEIAEMGISKIWVGFEGVKSNYEKQKGKPFKQLLSELRNYGIAVDASMMVGFDYQNKDIIINELDELISCFPATMQILIFSPCVNTPLWESLDSQNRILEQMRKNYKLHDGFSLLFKHPNISQEELENLQKHLYDREYQLLGPSLYRTLYIQYQGYKNLKNSDNIILKKSADFFLKNLKKARILYRIGIKFAPNKNIKKKIEDQYLEITNSVGGLNLIMKLLQYLLMPFAWWTKIRFKHSLFLQPKSIKRKYN